MVSESLSAGVKIGGNVQSSALISNEKALRHSEKTACVCARVCEHLLSVVFSELQLLFFSIPGFERSGHGSAKVVKYQHLSIQLLFQLISEA